MILKNMLIITFHYPPSAAVGGLRIYRLAKDLVEYGYNINILTVKKRYIKENDFERFKEEKRLEIHKTGTLPKISLIVLNAIKKLGIIKDEKTESELSLKSSSKYILPEAKESSTKRCKRIINSFLLLPDENRNWVLPTIIRAIKIIKKNNINIVFTSCPPYSSHLIGLVLKHFINFKWIVDYRDPWVEPFNKLLYPTCRFSLQIEKLLEKMVIDKANLVTTTTENLNSKFIKIYDTEPKIKFYYLPNGFDRENYKEKKSLFDKFTISYAGTLYFGRSPEPVFMALKQLKKEGKIKEKEVILILVGNCKYIDGIKTKDLARKYNITNEVEIRNAISYREAIEITQKSHLGLVLAPKQAYQIPAKIYDMMGSKTKVLAIADNGATKKLVEDYRLGKCFHWTDVEGIKNFISEEIKNKESKIGGWHKINNTFNQKIISRNFDLRIEKLLHNY